MSGPKTTSHASLLPILLLAMILLSLAGEAVSAQEQEIAYDDGSDEWNWWWNTNQIGGVFAVTFDSPYTPLNLVSVRIFFKEPGPFQLDVWDCTGNVDTPCTKVAGRQYTAQSGEEWFTASLSDTPITIKGSSFFIGVEWTMGGSPKIGFDTDTWGHSHVYDPSTQKWSSVKDSAIRGSSPDGNFMIRATVRPVLPVLTIKLEPQGEISGSVTVDGKNLSIVNGQVLVDVSLGQHSIEVPAQVDLGAGKRAVFQGWSDGDKSNPREVSLQTDMALTAVYRIQYLLTILTDKGTSQGSGWYDSGAQASFSVSSGGFLSLEVFDHWEGDSSGTSSSGSLAMDGPKTVRAVWRIDYTQPIIVIILIVAVIVSVGFVSKRRRSTSSTRRSDKPEESRPFYCRNCQARLPADAEFCGECGHPVKATS